MVGEYPEHEPDESASFGACATRLLAVLQGGEPTPSASSDLDTVLDGLSRFLSGRFQTLSSSDIADITSESLLRLLEASNAGQVSSDRSPAPYLTRIAHNLAVSRLRRPVTQELSEEQPALGDDELARLLDIDATHERLKAALAEAARAGDHMLVRVAGTWLSLAQSRGSAPASREVAEHLGVSHTTVNEAIGRLRQYLPK